MLGKLFLQVIEVHSSQEDPTDICEAPHCSFLTRAAHHRSHRCHEVRLLQGIIVVK